jgi:hypothetical protein
LSRLTAGAYLRRSPRGVGADVKADAASLLREVFDALNAHDLDRVAAVADEHTGPLETPDGEVPPTGRRIEIEFSVVARARDGLLVDGREYYDSMTFLTQLGLVPESAETAG